MPPKSFADRRTGRIARAGSRIGAALLLWAATPSGAGAVVGGSESAGPLAAATLMVLNSRGGVCSGVVIARDAILTAAHCVAGGTDIRVHYRHAGAEPVLITPKAVAPHTGYDSGAVAGRRRSIDLALLRLPEALPGRFGVPSLGADPVPRDAAILLGGYGVAREGDARSTGTFRTAELKAVEPYGRSTILLWASGRTGVGACEGDSGGPIANGADAVVAVTSWAAGAGRRGCGGMSQGVLVGPQRAWIDRILARWGRAADWR